MRTGVGLLRGVGAGYPQPLPAPTPSPQDATGVGQVGLPLALRTGLRELLDSNRLEFESQVLQFLIALPVSKPVLL